MSRFEKLPQEIQETMLERQVDAGNRRDPNIFIKHLSASTHSGGFNWCDSVEGEDFWMEVIDDNDIEAYYYVYPKIESPIKPEYESLYKKTFKQNRICMKTIDIQEIKKQGLEHILKI